MSMRQALTKALAELRELRSCVPLERSQSARYKKDPLPIARVVPARTSLPSQLQSDGDNDFVSRDTSQQPGNSGNSVSPTPTEDYNIGDYITENVITVSSESDDDWQFDLAVHLSRLSPPKHTPPPPIFPLPGSYNSRNVPIARTCLTPEVIVMRVRCRCIVLFPAYHCIGVCHNF